MIGMSERETLQERWVRNFQAAAPTLRAAAEALSPVLALVAEQIRAAARVTAEATMKMLATPTPHPRRQAVRKPCAWCGDSRKRPATHVVKWTQGLKWELPPEEGGGVWRVLVGHRMIMCQFHAWIAERYDGVKIYRFRRLK